MRVRSVYSVLHVAAGWLLPPRCVLCQRPGQATGFDLCRGCELEMPGIACACPRCGLPAGTTGAAAGPCAACLAVPPPQVRLVAPWAYEFPVTHLLQGLKYEGALANARVAGLLLAAALGRRSMGCPLAAGPSLVVPVPLHALRLQERGYNQAQEIARVVAAQLGLPLEPRALRRVRATPTQVGLARLERERNLQSAFVADSRRVQGRRIALVDDVVTTGSTVASASRTLLDAGAAEVVVWAMARALG